MKITILYQVSHYIREKNRNIKSWDQQNILVIRGFCYIRPLYNEVPPVLAKSQLNEPCCIHVMLKNSLIRVLNFLYLIHLLLILFIEIDAYCVHSVESTPKSCYLIHLLLVY